MTMAAKSQNTGVEYLRTAQAWTAAQVLEIWEKVKSGDSIRGWAEGKAFEYLVIRAFELAGLKVRWPFEVKYPQKFGIMEQLDGVVYLDERAFLVESKDLSEAASIEALA